jgi:iron(III) transport system permease protein
VPPALALAIAGALGLFIVLPVGRVLVTSLQGDAGLSLRHYAEFFRTPYFFLSLRNSVVLASTVTLLTVIVGFAVASATTRGPRRLRGPLRLVALLPLVAPSYVFGVALIILGGRGGLFNQAFGTDVRILGWPGVILGQALTLFPLAYLMVENVLASVDRSLEDSASDLGASDLQVLHTVTLPLVAPGLLTAALMVFALSMADFATPTILGGRLAFLAQDALLLVIGAEYNLPMASVLCVFLMVPSLVVFLVQHRWLAGRSYVTVTGRGTAAEPRRTVPVVDLPCLALTLLACVAVLLPMAVVVTGAFTRFVGVNNALTLEHFTNLRGIRSLTAFLAALTYAFVNSMLTLSAIVFLISPGREPASSVIFAFARMGELGLASALSLLLIGVVLVTLGAVWAVARRSGRLALTP